MDADTTLTSKGQTTIPKAIRDSLDIKAGDRMTFTFLPATPLAALKVELEHPLQPLRPAHRPVLLRRGPRLNCWILENRLNPGHPLLAENHASLQ